MFESSGSEHEGHPGVRRAMLGLRLKSLAAFLLLLLPLVLLVAPNSRQPALIGGLLGIAGIDWLGRVLCLSLPLGPRNWIRNSVYLQTAAIAILVILLAAVGRWGFWLGIAGATILQGGAAYCFTRFLHGVAERLGRPDLAARAGDLRQLVKSGAFHAFGFGLTSLVGVTVLGLSVLLTGGLAILALPVGIAMLIIVLTPMLLLLLSVLIPLEWEYLRLLRDLSALLPVPPMAMSADQPPSAADP